MAGILVATHGGPTAEHAVLVVPIGSLASTSGTTKTAG
jgi:hypothetical protein